MPKGIIMEIIITLSIFTLVYLTFTLVRKNAFFLCLGLVFFSIIILYDYFSFMNNPTLYGYPEMTTKEIQQEKEYHIFYLIISYILIMLYLKFKKNK